MKVRYLFTFFVLAFFVLFSVEAQAKKRLAILPFSGGEAQDGETISVLLSNQQALLSNFTVLPRNSAIERIMGEQVYQRQSGLINSDAISEIGKLNTADLVVSGYIAKLNDTNLILISIIDATEVQQIAGVYQTYRSIEEIRGFLPALSQRLVEMSRQNNQNLPGLAVPSFTVPSNVNANDAMVLAQILATEIVSLGKYAVYPRNNSVDDVLKEHEFQRSGQTADSMALGTSRGIEFILSSTVMGLGRMNLFASQILNIEGGNAIVGADQEYQNISDGLSKNLMRAIAEQLLGAKSSTLATASPSATTTTTASTPSTQSGNPNIILPSASWRTNHDNNSSARINIGSESIEGQLREVLAIEINLARGSPTWAGIALGGDDPGILRLKSGSGVRFKVLGDGKTWEFLVPTSDVTDSAFFSKTFATRSGRVIEVDMPYSGLKQPEWGRRGRFNKNNIIGITFQRTNNTSGGTGASTIKIFDIQVY